MNWDAIGAFGEILAALAVLGSLLYLAVQIKQAINSVEGATELEASKQFTEWHSRITNSGKLQSIWDKAFAGEPLSDEEKTTYIWLHAELFVMAQGLFRQYERGLLPASSWEPIEIVLLRTLLNDLVEAWWDEESTPISNDFRAYINEARKKVPLSAFPGAKSIGRETGI